MRADDLAAHVIAELDAETSGRSIRREIDRRRARLRESGGRGQPERRAHGAAARGAAGRACPGETVNRLCASGMSAVANAARAIKLGEGDLYVAGGVENMTRAPYVMTKASKPFGRATSSCSTRASAGGSSTRG